jgi:hypothetical protein
MGTVSAGRARWIATWARTPSTQALDELVPPEVAPAAPLFRGQTLARSRA